MKVLSALCGIFLQGADRRFVAFYSASSRTHLTPILTGPKKAR